MRYLTVWRKVLGLAQCVVEDVDADEAARRLVVSVRPRRGANKPRCGVCGGLSPRYDQGRRRRRWRAMDVGLWQCFLEADAYRVSCPHHGVVVRQVPWARHRSRLTRDFEDQVAWLAVRTSKTAVTALMRVTWRTVTAVVERVVCEARGRGEPLDGLRRIGIDEISYRRGQRYLMVVVDHDTGRLVWIHDGHSRATLEGFFDQLGEERTAAITLISADGAPYIAEVVAARCPDAVMCIDPFHVVAWVTEALDAVRNGVWRQHNRTRGGKAIARQLRGCRYVLWRGAERLDAKGRSRLEWVEQVNRDLFRAYLLKEQLRAVFQLRGSEAVDAFDAWLEETESSGILEMANVAARCRRYRDGIEATLTYGLSNALVESVNTKLRLLSRLAFGFKQPQNFIALAELDRGGYLPRLPGRTAHNAA